MNAKLRPFFERYRRLVFERARILLGDGDEANDALQDVFLRVITSETHILDQPSPVSWLYRVTTNLCLNRLRDERRRRVLVTERNQTDPGAAVEDPETLAMALQLLSVVPQEIRQIAVYRFVHEMTHDEIARRVGVSPRTVGNRLATFHQRVTVVLRSAARSRIDAREGAAPALTAAPIPARRTDRFAGVSP